MHVFFFFFFFQCTGPLFLEKFSVSFLVLVYMHSVHKCMMENSCQNVILGSQQHQRVNNSYMEMYQVLLVLL